MPSRRNTAVRRRPGPPPSAPVIALDTVRARQRLVRYREHAEAVLAQNRDALERLFETGLVFTRHGTQVGRELLQAHRHLLRVCDMISRGAGKAPLRSPRPKKVGESLVDEIESLLKKTSDIARRNKSLFQPSEPGF
jgi:hypothetical protein